MRYGSRVLARLACAAGIGLVVMTARAAPEAAPAPAPNPAPAHSPGRALKTEVKKTPLRRGASVAPLPPGKAKWTHAPFDGPCNVCHEKNDKKKPGPIRDASVNELCFECHDDVKDIFKRKYKHVAATEACTNCHNPHNSAQPALLDADVVTVCSSCHTGIRRQLAKGKVRHGAVLRTRSASTATTRTRPTSSACSSRSPSTSACSATRRTASSPTTARC